MGYNPGEKRCPGEQVDIQEGPKLSNGSSSQVGNEAKAAGDLHE